MANHDGYALDWDSEIVNDGEEFTILPDGSEVDFEVVELERARVGGSSKYAGAPMAKIKLKASNEHGTTTINENLILHSNMEWKLCQFFTCIGQRQHGEQLRPRWNEVVGAKGRGKVKVDKYTSTDNQGNKQERESNKIDKWLDPQPSGDAAATGGNQAHNYDISDSDF